MNLESLLKHMELEPPNYTPMTIILSPSDPPEARAKFEAAGYRVIEAVSK